MKLGNNFPQKIISTSWLHWLIAISVIALGLIAGEWLAKEMVFERAAYWVYAKLQSSNPRPIRPRRTVLVLIGDNEFYGSRLEHRTPINRGYLADLVKALSKAGPELIAIDFTMRSPSGVNSKESDLYRAETDALKQSLKEASNRTKIVLATTIQKTKDYYSEEPTVLDELGSDRRHLARGFVNLPDDLRRVPLAVNGENSEELDSFCMAAVRLVDNAALQEAEGNRFGAFPFGTFIEPSRFKRLSATDVLSKDSASLNSEVGCKIVLIGGVWHETPQGRPFERDLFVSPVGKIEGVFVHANFIESMLDSRMYRPLQHRVSIALDIHAAIIVALVLALQIALWRRLAIVLLFCGCLVLLSYILWQNLGVFFDSFLPIGLLMAHVAVEKLLGT